MPRSEKFANPFYALLLVAGIAFAVTAAAYYVMTLRDAHITTESTETIAPSPEHALITWMRRHGTTALIVELALLAAFVFAAIATDDHWQQRHR